MRKAAAERPAQPADVTMTSGLARQQRERERALRRLAKLRSKAADEIERLLLFLDASDLDPDLEPSLGWTVNGARSYGNDLGADDLEAEPEHDEDGADDERGGDDEPSMGSLDGRGEQIGWAAGDRRDLEVDGAESGVADLDGMLEQVGCGGWQGDRTGMG
jgi:hypothetical protein